MTCKKKILFLCTGNSCRSQMAEGLANALRGDLIEAKSAGTKPQALNPYAVMVMRELGIDISQNRSKSVEELEERKFDFVVTVCDDAHEQCPLWPGRGKVVHHSFDDPPRLAAGLKDQAEILGVYRRVRDEIRAYVEILPAKVENEL